VCAAPSRKDAAEARAAQPGSTLVSPLDPELILQVPINDEPAPELSIVIPALNEELTITEFVSWCQEGLARAGVRG